MDAEPTTSTHRIGLSDFLSVAERTLPVLTPLSVQTAITTLNGVDDSGSRMGAFGIGWHKAYWGENGLVLDFANHEDLAMFKIASKEPCQA